MTLLVVLLALVIVGLCGAAAELVFAYSEGGILVTIIIGVIGAYLGGGLRRLAGYVLGPVQLGPVYLWLPWVMPIRVGGIIIDLFWTFVGSLVVLLLLLLLRRWLLRPARAV
jgi:uncharacterized membrane protein YeaQ/YmgE (transglycosylase-associated protein family)